MAGAMYYDYEKERREAFDAGFTALQSLKAAREDLKSAGNWGIVDMFGGGLVSTLVKHSKMDRARGHLEEAKYNLHCFSRELQDVCMSCDTNLDTGDFLSFADWFFDGFVVDWMVQDKINRARAQVDEAIRMVSRLLNQLQD